MDPELDQITARWQLTARDRQRLSTAAGDHEARLLASCQDIDRALVYLLGDPCTVADWLRRPHPALYHARPLSLLLGSQRGCQWLRRALLEEAADEGDWAGEVARRDIR